MYFKPEKFLAELSWGCSVPAVCSPGYVGSAVLNAPRAQLNWSKGKEMGKEGNLSETPPVGSSRYFCSSV